MYVIESSGIPHSAKDLSTKPHSSIWLYWCFILFRTCQLTLKPITRCRNVCCQWDTTVPSDSRIDVTSVRPSAQSCDWSTNHALLRENPQVQSIRWLKTLRVCIVWRIMHKFLSQMCLLTSLWKERPFSPDILPEILKWWNETWDVAALCMNGTVSTTGRSELYLCWIVCSNSGPRKSSLYDAWRKTAGDDCRALSSAMVAMPGSGPCRIEDLNLLLAGTVHKIGPPIMGRTMIVLYSLGCLNMPAM